MIVGVISDTHGLMRETVADALSGVDLIVHAGDVGTPDVLTALRAIARTIVVRGNVDTAPWCTVLPETAIVQAGAVQLYVLHQLAQLAFDPAAAGYRAVIYGHSHRASIEERGGVVYLNPGAAGPRRFDIQPSLARVTVRGTDLDVSLVRL